MNQTSVTIYPDIPNDSNYLRIQNKQCNECEHKEAIYFQILNINESGMKLFVMELLDKIAYIKSISENIICKPNLCSKITLDLLIYLKIICFVHNLF